MKLWYSAKKNTKTFKKTNILDILKSNYDGHKKKKNKNENKKKNS